MSCLRPSPCFTSFPAAGVQILSLNWVSGRYSLWCSVRQYLANCLLNWTSSSRVLTIDKHLKETHLENNLFMFKSVLSGITMQCTNSGTAIIPQTHRLITASNRETCSPKEPSSPKVLLDRSKFNEHTCKAGATRSLSDGLRAIDAGKVCQGKIPGSSN